MVTTPIWINSTNSPACFQFRCFGSVTPMGFPGNDLIRGRFFVIVPAMIPLRQVTVFPPLFQSMFTLR